MTRRSGPLQSAPRRTDPSDVEYAFHLLFVLALGLVAVQMRRAMGAPLGLISKLREPVFLEKLKQGESDAVRELAELIRAQTGEDDVAVGERIQVIIERAGGRRTGAASPASRPPAGAASELRFERAGSWPLLLAVAVAVLLVFLQLRL